MTPTARVMLFAQVLGPFFQTAVAIYLVTRSRFNNRNLIEPVMLEMWFLAYIELLHRLKLYSEALKV